MHSSEITSKHQTELLTLAREVIQQGANAPDFDPQKRAQQALDNALEKLTHDPSQSPLTDPGCCFVTLHLNGQLRGCIGSLSPYQPLIKDVVVHAYAAAFNDYRFSPVTSNEVDALHIEISVISPEKAIPCNTEAELLAELTPGVDGLTIEDGLQKATFLPSVWEQLPNKQQFLDQLRLKAGMSKSHWSDNFKAYRYHTLSFEE